MSSDRPPFEHFMLREIYEQPQVVQDCLEHYLNPRTSSSEFASSAIALGIPPEFLAEVEQIHLLACGTSFHASLIAQALLEQWIGIPTRVRIASTFCDAPLPLTPNTVTIAVTQSGETADTLNALALDQQRRSHQAPELQQRSLGITNQPNSTLTQRVQHTLPALSGKEVGIAATKSFMAQLVVFYSLALDLAARRQTLPSDRIDALIQGLERLPGQMNQILEESDAIAHLAKELVNTQNVICLGRGINHAIALEGALKLKETSYSHAEGYASGEFLHGPIAMLDERVAVIAIAMPGPTYEQGLANLQKVKTRGARLIGLTTPDAATQDLFDAIVPLPTVDEWLSPFLTVIPLQLLAYYITVYRGLDVDRPRGLQKSLSAS